MNINAVGSTITATHDFRLTCPVCSTDALHCRYQFDDFDVMVCKSCASSWRTNMYDDSKLEEIYCSEDYENHPYFDQSIDQEKIIGSERLGNFERGFALLESLSTKGRFLDVGSGSGAVVGIAGRRGWDAEGVEMSPGLAQKSAERYGAIVHCGTFEAVEIPPASFDVLTFWDIIEHVVDPVSVIRRARDLLKDNGLVLFCTPDESSWLAGLGHLLYRFGYKYPALALHPENHTYFFERGNFQNILEASGFEVERAYSQSAYFEHSPLASRVQKMGISMVEKTSSAVDRQYEMVFIARARK